MMANYSAGGNLANLVATIDSVAAGSEHTTDDVHDQVVTAEMLEGTVLHLSNGQSIDVVQMPASLEDTINVVQVETTELADHHVGTVEEICEMEIDSEEQQHILSETGAHVVVKTEVEDSMLLSEHGHGLHTEKSTPQLPTMPQIPFSFPGQTFDTKCQKLILNVWDFFRRVKRNPDLLDGIRTPQERAAAALHISAATIGKIGKNFKRTVKLETPGKKRQRSKPVVDSVNSSHEDTIRRIIKEFKDNRITPTLPLILNECRVRINFQGGATSFRRILQRMGFRGLMTKHVPPSPSSKSKPLNSTSSTSTSRGLYQNATSEVKASPMKKDHFISLPITSPTLSPSRKLTFRPLIPPSPTSTVSTSTRPSFSTTTQNISKQASRVMANLLGGNVLQLGTNGKGEPITISQQTAAAIANATSRLCDGPQTIHVLQPDNTVQQIQVVYANMS